jgi:K+-transporting ATPase ATPase A chain
MPLNALIQIVVYFAVLLLLAKPLGSYMARVFEGQGLFGLDRVLGPIERGIYRITGVQPSQEMHWTRYAGATLIFQLLGFLTVYAMMRLQEVLPLNPQGLPATSGPLSFNTAVSFATNTNWQAYGGESTLSYLVQMAGLTVQNFVSAAMGIAVVAAFIRGLARRSAATIGNFWVDLVRTTLYILLPLAIVLALIQVSQGVIQNFSPYQTATLVEATVDADGAPVATQSLAMGPAASQIAIKQLGTNGGGFFNVNSAHPYENSTPFSNFFEMLAILLISGGLCYTFGKMVGDTRQGWAVLAAMTILLLPLLAVAEVAEYQGNPVFTSLGIDQAANDLQPGGNMEGKEVRFGIANSALWASATTAASNGSVNSMHDSFTPLGGLVPMWLMQLGEVIYGGVGSGLYGMLIFAILAVFIAGLMVGRTPEYLGKKVQAFEMKMALVAVLVPPAMVLLGTGAAAVTDAGLAGLNNSGPHGFSEMLYAFSSMGNNNGSAFAGLTASGPFYATLGGFAMLFARYWVALPALAIAGSMARKQRIPAGLGTLPTHTPMFVVLLMATVLLVGALTFFPALALGPIVEHFLLRAGAMF